MKNFLSQVEKQITHLINGKDGTRNSAYIISEDVIKENITELKQNFPTDTKHYFAIKANPLDCVLKIVANMGLGAECASLEEVKIAKARFSTDKIIFDSPCKTISDLNYCVQDHIRINVDNFEELERLQEVLKNATEKDRSAFKVGLRINPQISPGTILETSTATATSKFGICVKEDGVKDKILKWIADMPQIDSLHSHVGSGGMTFDNLISGIKCITELAIEINKSYLKEPRIKILDIGGGFPVESNIEKSYFLFLDYIGQIQCFVPEALKFQIATEFGRGIIASAGITLSKIEYVKYSGGRQIAITHLGADMFVWTAYSGGKMMKLCPLFYNNKGELIKKEMCEDKEKQKLDVVGPLCFSGDNICVGIDYIKELKSGDLVLIPYTGAYTMSCWSVLNSRKTPPIYINGGDVFEYIKTSESFYTLWN
jgi:diaminopimelate decarboxylase